MISVLLPTVRPERIQRALGSLLAQSGDVPLEIVVVADFAMPELVRHDSIASECSKFQWYVRGRRGVVDAANVAYGVSTGDVVFITNDQTTYRPDCLRLLHEAAMMRQDVLWAADHKPYFPFYYYNKFFAAFACAHRNLIEQLGGFFDPVYRSFYADPDLSMRAHATGVPVQTVPGALIDHINVHDAGHNQSVDKWLLADRAQFRARWDHLGAFRDP